MIRSSTSTGYLTSLEGMVLCEVETMATTCRTTTGSLRLVGEIRKDHSSSVAVFVRLVAFCASHGCSIHQSLERHRESCVSNKKGMDLACDSSFSRDGLIDCLQLYAVVTGDVVLLCLSRIGCALQRIDAAVLPLMGSIGRLGRLTLCNDRSCEV